MTMNDRRVWIAQCLCGPNRHTIMAASDEFDSEADALTLLPKLREAVAEMRISFINPWCSICGSEAWIYEISSTRFRTMKEAAPEFSKTEAENVMINLLYGTHGPDRPRSV